MAEDKLLTYFTKNKLTNKKNYAPQGVIFISDEKAFVGMDHVQSKQGKPPLISSDIFDRLLPIAKLGLYYEGIKGADVKQTEPLFGKYKASWDDMSVKSVRGHPSEFLYALFSNDPPESLSNMIVGPKTIFDAMLRAGVKISSFKKRGFDKKTLEEFLINISSSKIDFLTLSFQKANKQNAEQFLKMGAAEMWPPGKWERYPNPAGKVAEKASDFRDKWCAESSPAGLYTIGAGHLFAISKFTGAPIIGGDSIKT